MGPLSWGQGDFWEITGQEAFQWDEDIRANNGDSWCICMWATAHLISSAGCDNVHVNCEATDVSYVLSSYKDGGGDLAPAKKCLQKKCPDLKPTQLNDAQLPVLSDAGKSLSSVQRLELQCLALGVAVLGATMALGLLAHVVRVLRAHRSRDAQQPCE